MATGISARCLSERTCGQNGNRNYYPPCCGFFIFKSTSNLIRGCGVDGDLKEIAPVVKSNAKHLQPCVRLDQGIFLEANMEIIRGKIEALNESQKKQKSEEKSGQTAKELFYANAKEVPHPAA